MSNENKIITISVQLNVGLSVNAYRDEDGEVQIESVRGVIGLPFPLEIYEAMTSDDLAALDAAFEEAP